MEAINANTRIIDLTVGQLMDIIGQHSADNTTPQRRMVYGIDGIAQLFNCSIATANRIKASGKIDRAISQCGRKITVDADLALELLHLNK